MGIKRIAATLGTGLLFREIKRRQTPASLAGQLVLVTGGSRGLGLLLAREFNRQGCRVIICARDASELERAKQTLQQQGMTAETYTCDVTQRLQVERMLEDISRTHGEIDILVNNAGIIQVAPVENTRVENYQEAQAVIFWGTIYPTLAVLPKMLERKAGRIVNIASVGGKISVPHLLPYSAAKFGVVGFSEGLRAEVKKSGISVTTVTPGTMRTGSHLNALFSGQEQKEFSWFSLAASLPFVSLDAEVAAQKIVKATRLGQANCAIPLFINIATRLHGLAPELSAEILALVNRFLPDPTEVQGTLTPGIKVQNKMNSSILEAATLLGRNAARRFNQFPGFTKKS